MWFDAFRNIFGHHSKGGLMYLEVCVGTGRCLLLPRTGRQLGLTHTCETHITSWIFSGSIGLPWLAVIVGSTICHLQLMFYWEIAEITIFFLLKIVVKRLFFVLLKNSWDNHFLFIENGNFHVMAHGSFSVAIKSYCYHFILGGNSYGINKAGDWDIFQRKIPRQS